jgi:hypothetical protein
MSAPAAVRRTAATIARRAGAPRPDVKALLEHLQGDVSDVYDNTIATANPVLPTRHGRTVDMTRAFLAIVFPGVTALVFVSLIALQRTIGS